MCDEQPSDRVALRRAMRAERRALTVDEREINAAAVATRTLALLGECARARTGRPLWVGATIADDGELDPAPLVAALFEQGARVAYARVAGGTMDFALVESADAVVVGPGGVHQPLTAATAMAPDELDVVLVPVVAFDRRCERIGRGGGHYDRTFAGRTTPPPLLIGLAHDGQLVADVAPASHDVALDHVVTPTRVFTRIGS